MAGAQMQTALNNPLASPFTLGISAAASFGAALGLALEIVQWRIAGFARIEWGDVASNEGGVLVAWGVAWWGQRRHAIS